MEHCHQKLGLIHIASDLFWFIFSKSLTVCKKLFCAIVNLIWFRHNSSCLGGKWHDTGHGFLSHYLHLPLDLGDQ